MEAKFNLAILLVACFAWQVQCQVNCTSAGRFADPADATCQNYTLCVANGGAFLSYNYVCPTTSVFNPSTSQCTTNYTCTATTTNPTNTGPCTADGFFSDPNTTDCSSYIQCVNINGNYTVTTFTCPTNTFYDPNTTLCESNYNCTSTTFTCSTAGRFANSADTTCQTYYYCVLQTNGTFVQYEYTCPTTSVFSPTSNLCTTSYTCSS